MVDWLSVEVPDPFGEYIHGGEVTKVAETGEILWTTRCKREFQGSWSGKMQVRNLMAERSIAAGTGINVQQMSGLELQGNPAKFLTGHNLFGSADVTALTSAVVQAVGSALYPERDFSGVDVSGGEISRIDLTASWLLDRPEDVLPFLKAMEDRVWCPYRGRGVSPADGPGTLYYGFSQKGKRAKDWQLKLYSKGRDVTVHKLPPPAYAVPGLLDDVNRTIRVELTLRSAELKRLNMRRVSDWTPERVEEVWRSYVDRLDFGDGTMRLDNNDLSGFVKPRLLDAISSWKAGNDLRIGRSKANFYKLRKEIREAVGVDIAVNVPTSNVVPLRRVIEAKPALYPHWADQLTAALRKAA